MDSCQSYKMAGVTETGYYYMTSSGSSNLEYNYCDFEVMDYSTCSDYFKAGVNESGSYNVYLNGKTVSVHCDFSSGIQVFLTYSALDL